eukprot:5893710-Ditylum_brightwellii.AAC.1
MAPNAGNRRGKQKGPPMNCSSCGHTDYQRRLSKKCSHFKEKEMSRSSKTEGEDVDVATNNGGVSSNNNNHADNNANTSVAAIADATVSYPNFIKVKSRRRCTYEPFVDVASPVFKTRDTMFQVSQRYYQGRRVEVETSP